MRSIEFKHEHEGLKRYYLHGDLSVEPGHSLRFFYDRRADAFVPVELAQGGNAVDVSWLRMQLRNEEMPRRGHFRPEKAMKLNVFAKHPLMKADLRLLKRLENYHREHFGQESRAKALEEWEKVNGPVP
ncbi:MAG: hypothetical protein Q8K32_11100 [Archangium sp.]|nr:hypothetical protein [Archangium sp.]